MGKNKKIPHAFAEESKEPIIIYFNEPERNGISPAEAAEIWHKQVVHLKAKGKKLCSPSCSNDAAGQKWIEDFMHRVAGEPPDFVGLHYYGTDENAAQKYIEMMHGKFKRDIMVTEVASISRNPQDVLKFTAHLANWMDGTEWIKEYGFFGCMKQMPDNFVSPEARLMNPDGSFSHLGHLLMTEEPIKA